MGSQSLTPAAATFEETQRETNQEGEDSEGHEKDT